MRFDGKSKAYFKGVLYARIPKYTQAETLIRPILRSPIPSDPLRLSDLTTFGTNTPASTLSKKRDQGMKLITIDIEIHIFHSQSVHEIRLILINSFIEVTSRQISVSEQLPPMPFNDTIRFLRLRFSSSWKPSFDFSGRRRSSQPTTYQALRSSSNISILESTSLPASP
jgi:hypothetical protein